MKLEYQCAMDGWMGMFKQTVTHNSETAQTQRMEITYTPPMRGVSKIVTISEYTYAGSCPTGMSNGDMRMPNGEIIHSPLPKKALKGVGSG